MANLFRVRLDYFSQVSYDTNFDMTAVAFRDESNITRKVTDRYGLTTINHLLF